MFNKIVSMTITFIVLISLLHSPLTAVTKGMVTADNVNIRSGPGLDYEVIGQAQINSSVDILEESSGWVKIHIGQIEGWMSKEFIKQQSSPSQQANTIQITVEDTEVDVQKEPSLTSEIIGKVQSGETYELLEEKNAWYQIQLSSGDKGWINQWLAEKVAGANATDSITTVYDQTHFRSGPSLNHEIIEITDKNKTFQVISKQGNWYEVELDGQNVYVEESLVSDGEDEKSKESDSLLKNKRIVIDAGHGGADTGTISASGDYEKFITTKTAHYLANKLEALGAVPILTRTDVHTFLPLSTRVAYSNAYQADAFVSIHYNSAPQFPNVHGIGTFYYHDAHKELATLIHDEVIKATGFKDRQVRFGDFLVIRENKQPAVLLELGFLSNDEEERTINSSSFQEKATNGIVRGLLKYFD
ncbi:N-acetylmuramoyl-L-alanine amidase [Salinibacillus xinjiangensis]|uniref:SH3 domain-containing protein n=1 Tax=Salinibacillus xinjiangensis TaxID=1229268 RepID=A0A6G1XBK5_9BACI|nr:N-acetylmuramoyl-L-alanine amidase [Salinibacillus xinjiangensis]MRG88260.1 SH3 domain-containing protein [Salinibacillus xinjiangensis]